MGGSKRRIPARAVVALAAGFSLLAGQAQAISTCALQDEQAALDTRVLQSELVIAALSCGASSDYNAFALKFQDRLVALGKSFRGYFDRLYGPDGENRMDKTVTRLANIASVRSMGLGPQYCPYVAQVFQVLQSVEPDQLPAFAAQNPYVNDHDVKPCPIQVQAQTQSAPVALTPDQAPADSVSAGRPALPDPTSSGQAASPDQAAPVPAAAGQAAPDQAWPDKP